MRRFVGSLALLVAAYAAGDTQVAHSCDAPVRPINDSEDITWNAFIADVDDYRECISTFVESNHAAADVHRNAANQATKDWNEFVHRELNVPEDFPWTPDNDKGASHRSPAHPNVASNNETASHPSLFATHMTGPPRRQRIGSLPKAHAGLSK